LNTKRLWLLALIASSVSNAVLAQGCGVAPTSNYFTGSGNTTGTASTPFTTTINAPTTSTRAYGYVQCKNSGATTTQVTLNDLANTVLIAAAAGGDNGGNICPLKWALGTVPAFTPSAGSTTVYCNIQGWIGQ
jgi:hypothetical protein